MNAFKIGERVIAPVGSQRNENLRVLSWMVRFYLIVLFGRRPTGGMSPLLRRSGKAVSRQPTLDIDNEYSLIEVVG